MIKQNIDLTHITQVQVNHWITPVHVYQGETTHLHYEGNRPLVINVEGDKLIIEDRDVKNSKSHMLKKQVSKETLTIVVATKVDFLDIGVLVGGITLSSLSVPDINVDFAKGSLKAHALEVTHKMEVSGGFGAVDILSSDIQYLEITLGVGGIKVHQSRIGTLKQSTGIGSVSFKQSDILHQI